MEKKPKYLYTDGILKGKENLIFLILDEKEPSGLLSKDEKLNQHHHSPQLADQSYLFRGIGTRRTM